ncbi:DUF3924 family protein [Metabacillus fastidiosus]|uniref:DUF3924 family protein n=1 Tax=Metabacillus fastidiosus TaxID=1458 RepID=UPI002DBD9521|nr:DUF3924 family protein [Metabacillus fastidiosus]MEC2077682.1 DUF3924 family protein [Metabacillus fastidiosus]
MQTIKTITIRLNEQEVNYVQLLQNKYKQKFGINISQSALFRLLLQKEAEKLQLEEEEIKTRDANLMQRLRNIQQEKQNK